MRAVLLAVVVVASVAWGLMAGVRGSERERQTLRGVGPFSVVIEGICDAGERNGLSKDALKNITELRLRRNGIRLDDKALPYLYININVIADSEIATYSVAVHFKQNARLVANMDFAVVTTWESETLGICRPTNLNGRVIDCLDRFVDQFSNDYLAANEQVEAGTGR